MKKFRVFVVEYQDGARRCRHPESLPAAIAYAFGRELAIQGRKPTVRRLDLPESELRTLFSRFEVHKRAI